MDKDLGSHCLRETPSHPDDPVGPSGAKGGEEACGLVGGLASYGYVF